MQGDTAETAQPELDEELLLACVRAGGARGAIRTAFGNQTAPEWQSERDALQSAIEGIGKQLRMEQMAAALARQN